MKLEKIQFFVSQFSLEKTRPNQKLLITNNSVFVRIKFNLIYFSVILPRSRDQTKQTLAVTLLFQFNFLLVVGMTIWYNNFIFL